MKDHLLRHKEALELIRIQFATGMDAVDATEVVAEEFGLDALRTFPTESDWDSAHNLVKLLLTEYGAEIIPAVELMGTLFGPELVLSFDRILNDIYYSRQSNGAN